MTGYQNGNTDAARWRRRRRILRFGLVVWFGCVVYFGRNIFLFHRLGPITAADFAADVQRNMVPVVRAMKEYERANGQLPSSCFDLYGNNPTQQQIRYSHGVGDGGYDCEAEYGVVNYDFSPDREGWYVRGPFANGRIPLPRVTIDAATRPSNQP